MNYKNVYELVNNNNNEAIKLLKTIDNTDLQIKILKIKSYSKHVLYFNEAINILNSIEEKKLKKRMFMPILNSLINFNKKKVQEFLNYISSKYFLNEDDLQFFLNNNININNIISKNCIILNKNYFNKNELIIKKKCPNCLNELKKDYINKSILITQFNKHYSFSFNNIKNYNTFIDGNNIIFYDNKKVIYKSFIKLRVIYDKLIKLNYKPIIILHRRHRDFLKKNFPKKYKDIKLILKSLNIFYTPYKQNDDLYFIYGALKTENSYIVTNDKLRDHIFKSKDDNISRLYSKWLETVIIRYTYNNKIIEPNKVSQIAQNINNIWHLPLKNGKWICLK